MSGGQGLDDAVLAAVGVLVLVDQQVIEAAGLGLRGPWETAAKSSSVQQQQVVEIDARRPPSGPSDSGDRPTAARCSLSVWASEAACFGPDRGRLPAADEVEQIAGPQQRRRPP